MVSLASDSSIYLQGSLDVLLKGIFMYGSTSLQSLDDPANRSAIVGLILQQVQ